MAKAENAENVELRKTAEGFSARVTLEWKSRKDFPLPSTMSETEARARCAYLSATASRLRRAWPADDIERLLGFGAAAATPLAWEAFEVTAGKSAEAANVDSAVMAMMTWRPAAHVHIPRAPSAFCRRSEASARSVGRPLLGARPAFGQPTLRSRSGVYFVQSGGPWFVKIGVTSDIRKRLDMFECATPFPVYLRSFVPEANRDDEMALHRIFESDRAHGEWFRTSELLEHVMQLAYQELARAEYGAAVAD